MPAPSGAGGFPTPPVESVRETSRREPRLPGKVGRLVAAVVPGGIDFSGDVPRPSSGEPLVMYRHPADKNAAATGVAAGRRLDVRG